MNQVGILKKGFFKKSDAHWTNIKASKDAQATKFESVRRNMIAMVDKVRLEI